MIDLVSEFTANVPKLRFLTVSVCESLVGLKHLSSPNPARLRLLP